MTARRSSIAATRKRWKAIDATEFERVRQKLLSRPPLPLEEYEVAILLRQFNERDATPNMGAPAVLSEQHRFMAVHYWWLIETGMKRHARKRVGTRWGVSEKSVEKYAVEHEDSAREYVRNAIAKYEDEPDLHPKWATEQLLDILAAEFKKLGQ